MRTPYLMAALACASLLAACGGGGDAPATDPVTPPLAPVVATSTMTTPALTGFRSVACGNGVTCLDAVADSSGKFTMVVNGTLDIYVGPLKVMSAVDTSSAVTSVAAFSATADENDPTFVNEMTLLYSLDSDGDPTNGIDIDAAAQTAMASLPYSSIRFDVTPDAFVANPAVQTVIDGINAIKSKPGVSLTVKNPAQVKETLRRLFINQRWGGTWTMTMDDSSSTTQTFTVSDSGQAAVTNGPSFQLDTTSKTQAPFRFNDMTLGSFTGTLKSDGTGSGQWSRVGSQSGAGHWTAKRAN